MAAASSFLSADELQCSICLDVFTEPVSIPCGHNFCKNCISLHWKDKEYCQCPLCNHKFNKGLKLCVNTTFRDIVENLKKQSKSQSNNKLNLKPGQVACDCCLTTKSKASKTCLVCLTSFCETHLGPHRKVDALKTHKLVNPVQKLEQKICKKHNRIQELFCRNDKTRICVLCTEHSTHNTVPLEEAYVDKKALVVNKKAEVKEDKRRLGKKAQKSKIQNRRKGKFEHSQNFPDEFPNQCEIYQFVPKRLTFSNGKFCYWVDLTGGTSWCLGVVRERILRTKRIGADPSNGSWLILLDNCSCTGLHGAPVTFTFKKKPERVVVCVNYEKGLVSFSDADTGHCFYFFAGCVFNEAVGLFCGKKGSWIQSLRKKVENLTLKDLIFGFFVMVCLLIVILAESSAQPSAS